MEGVVPVVVMIDTFFFSLFVFNRRKNSLTASAGSIWQTWRILLFPWRSPWWTSTISPSTTSCSASVSSRSFIARRTANHVLGLGHRETPLCLSLRSKQRRRIGWSHRCTETPLWHLGEHCERGQSHGVYGGYGKHSGNVIFLFLAILVVLTGLYILYVSWSISIKYKLTVHGHHTTLSLQNYWKRS